MSVFIREKACFFRYFLFNCIEQIKAEQLRCRIIAGKSGFLPHLGMIFMLQRHFLRHSFVHPFGD
jgi:hypothetical protein